MQHQKRKVDRVLQTHAEKEMSTEDTLRTEEAVRTQRCTFSGIPLKPVYTPSDTSQNEYRARIGNPGEFPYTRGIYHQMYLEKPWLIHTYMGYGTTEQTNKRIKYLLKLARDPKDVAVSVAFDLPTQIGLDPDHPLARGEVGKVGASVFALREFRKLIAGVPLTKVGYINTAGNAIGPTFIAWCIAAAREEGIDPKLIRVNVQNDVLKEYCARGTYILPPEQGFKHACDAIEFCVRNYPSYIPIAVSGYHMREAGARSAAEELGLTIANAIAYIDESANRGLAPEKVVQSMRIFLGGGIDFLEEAAKFRAARRLWATLIKERYAIKNNEALKIRIQCYTHGMNLTAQQPLNNIVRVTIQALGAILGGVQWLSTSSYDEALSIPSEEALMVATRTQQIIKHETSLPYVADPLGGSYFIEWLTDEIENRARKVIDDVLSLGGAVKALESGYYHRVIAEGAAKFQKEIEDKVRIIVGVNEYKIEEEPDYKVFRPDPQTEKDAIASLQRLKKERNSQKVQESLNRLRKAADSGKNTVPAIIDAVHADATIGEIYGVFRDLFGEYRSYDIF